MKRKMLQTLIVNGFDISLLAKRVAKSYYLNSYGYNLKRRETKRLAINLNVI